MLPDFPALRSIWRTDIWDPETRCLTLLSRQLLQALILAAPCIVMLQLVLAITP
jgi:hypothetical protein